MKFLVILQNRKQKHCQEQSLVLKMWTLVPLGKFWPSHIYFTCIWNSWCKTKVVKCAFIGEPRVLNIKINFQIRGRKWLNYSYRLIHIRTPFWRNLLFAQCNRFPLFLDLFAKKEARFCTKNSSKEFGQVDCTRVQNRFW